MTASGTNASAAHLEVTSNNNYDIIRSQYELAYSKTRSHDECHDPETSAAIGYRRKSIQVSIDTINRCVHQRAEIRIVYLDSSIQLISKYTRTTIIKQLPKHSNSNYTNMMTEHGAHNNIHHWLNQFPEPWMRFKEIGMLLWDSRCQLWSCYRQSWMQYWCLSLNHSMQLYLV